MMYLNGRSLEEYGGNLEESYSVSGVDVTCNQVKGNHGGSLILLNQRFGLKEIRLPLVFNGSDPHTVRERYSQFCRNCIGGKKEMVLPDERQYTAVLTKIGREEWITENDMAVEVIFSGYCHGPLQSVRSNVVYCMSTLPVTDCIFRVTVSQAAPSYQVGSVTFRGVSAGDRLVADGMNKRILINDAPAAQRADWIRFPVLASGRNMVVCKDVPIVEYYPVYF
jgi:hypothetical protein